jgi:hypothetical protein
MPQVRVALIDTSQYTIIPNQNRPPPQKSESLLGRRVCLETENKFSLVYVGDHDPYSEETQLLESYIVPNVGTQNCISFSYFSPISNKTIVPFKKATTLISRRYANVERVKEA